MSPPDSGTVAGTVLLTLTQRTGGWSATLASRRPVTASRVLEGASARDGPRRVGSLFSICAQAHTVAALTAVEQALGLPAAEAALRLRLVAVEAEAVEQLLWRLVSGTEPAGRPALPDWFPPLRRVLHGAVQAIAPGLRWRDPAEAVVLDRAAARTLAQDITAAIAPIDSLLSASAAGGSLRELQRFAAARQDLALLGLLVADLPPPLAAVPPLPAVALPDIARAVAEDDDGSYRRAPLWHDRPHEVGVFAMLRDDPRLAGLGPGWAARTVAALISLKSRLHRLCEALCDDDVADPARRLGKVAEGWHAAAVETARGTLVHVVRLEGERIAGWHILAPTEWNFHPEGVICHAVHNLPAVSREQAERFTRALTALLDPCVPAILLPQRDASDA